MQKHVQEMPSAAMGVSDTTSTEVGFGFYACFYFMTNKKCFFILPSAYFFFFIDLAGILGLTLVSPNPSFSQIVTRFVLAWNSGWHTSQGVTPGLHLPLIPETVFIIAKCTIWCFLLLYASL